ncbi:glycine cleavage system H protein [Morchella snyderi]|nr:glycine cleavage system H protein [Morchella snyderi]
MASFARTLSLRAFSALTRSALPAQAPRAARAFSGSTRVYVTKFTKDHEWVSHDPSVSNIATIGITTYAANALGDVVFVELPEAGTTVAAGDAFGAVESVKSASDIMSPVSGEVVEANTALKDKPALINRSPEEDGWIVKVKVGEGQEAEFGELLGREEYEAFVKGEEH